MGVGTSMGAYYDDSFHAEAARWDPKYDTNEDIPKVTKVAQQAPPGLEGIPPEEVGRLMRQPSNIMPDQPSPLPSVTSDDGRIISFEQQPYIPEPPPPPPSFDERVNNYITQARRSMYEPFKSKAEGNQETKVGDMALIRKEPFNDIARTHYFNFFHEETGTKGSLSVSERDNGNTIHIGGIGLNDAITPNTIGTKGIKDLRKALQKEFPQAEKITGYRVSGARAYKGSGPTDATMWLPRNPDLTPNNKPPLQIDLSPKPVIIR